MIVSQKDMLDWLQPWPIAFRYNKKCKVYLTTIERASMLYSFWTYEGKRIRAKDALKKIRKEDWLGKRHQISSYVEHGKPWKKPTIVVSIVFGKKVIMDGNHTLLALLQSKKKVKVLVFERIN